MIEAGLEFAVEMQAPLIDAVFQLPRDVRPTHILSEEGRPAPAVSLPEALEVSLKAGTSILLEAPCGTIDVSAAPPGRIDMRCFFDAKPDLCKAFLIQMAVALPVFAFACASPEREERNLIRTRLGRNDIETWVGRDTFRYVPGLYWLTLLSSALVDRHLLSLSALERLAVEHFELPGDQHLFQFHEHPLVWADSKGIANLISETPGIFDISAAKSDLLRANDFTSLQMLAKRWP